MTNHRHLFTPVCLLSPLDTAYVRIFISDVNDNKPVFAQTVYEVDVDEDADVGSTILTVSANDEDEGKPGCEYTQIQVKERGSRGYLCTGIVRG